MNDVRRCPATIPFGDKGKPSPERFPRRRRLRPHQSLGQHNTHATRAWPSGSGWKLVPHHVEWTRQKYRRLKWFSQPAVSISVELHSLRGFSCRVFCIRPMRVGCVDSPLRDAGSRNLPSVLDYISVVCTPNWNFRNCCRTNYFARE